MTLSSPAERIGGFFALDDPWRREAGVERSDVLIGLVTLVLSAANLELARSTGSLEHVTAPVWAQWLAVGLGSGLLVARRRFPLTVAALAATHMFVVGITMPMVMAELAMQVVYFTGIFSGVAWARDRRDMLLVVGGVVAFMFAWLAWYFALGSGVGEIRRSLGEDADRSFGAVSPVAAGLLLSALVNVVYFGGAVLAGQVAWRSARQRARLAEQAEQLRSQGERLRRQAVVTERLRIARELHDVVAHHVSVIGINAAAARRVLDRDVQAAATALGQIEGSSREAVAQMRGLLGTLRAPDDDAGPPGTGTRPGEPGSGSGIPGSDVPGSGVPGGEPGGGASATGAGITGPNGGDLLGSRAPEPGLAELPALVEGHQIPGFTAGFRLVEEPAGAAADVPAPVALSVFRTAQEALANVRRHSTASRATVVLRVRRGPGGGHVEVEITDDGRPRHGTSGSGLGQLGIRERATSHGGTVEIGPRVGGGYRVRVRLPLSVPVAPLAARR